MHALPVPGPHLVDPRIGGPRTTPVHAFFGFGPQIYAFGPGIAGDHQIQIIGGMVGQGFDGHVVTTIDLHLRRERFTEVPPMHSVRIGRQIVE